MENKRVFVNASGLNRWARVILTRVLTDSLRRIGHRLFPPISLPWMDLRLYLQVTNLMAVIPCKIKYNWLPLSRVLSHTCGEVTSIAMPFCSYFLLFLLQTLMKEKQGNLSTLKQLKDFDERKSQEIAALVYQEQEIMKLEVIIKTIKM